MEVPPPDRERADRAQDSRDSGRRRPVFVAPDAIARSAERGPPLASRHPRQLRQGDDPRDLLLRSRHGHPPIVAVARAASCAHEIAVGIELEHWRCVRAAAAGWRVHTSRRFGFRVERLRAMDSPDAVAGIRRHAGDSTDSPVVRQRLRSGRVHLDAQHLALVTLRCGCRRSGRVRRRRGTWMPPTGP
jgi:hypothetical protein